MQKKNHKLIETIIIAISVLVMLLLIFSEDIIKLLNRNKLNIAESIDSVETTGEPNMPKLSAGMIPVKFDGENWVITTKEDSDWYDYAQGKPAYIMLNDGTYQSELVVDMTNKKLASDAVGNDAHVVPPDQLGSIYMWIPRFEINNDTQEVKYIKDIQEAEEGFTIPDLFSYKQTEETKPDFLLTGIWLEKDIDTNYSNKIIQMNLEESIYGFLAHTKATQITSDDINSIQKYTSTIDNGTTGASFPTIDTTNLNRIILKIINNNNQDPIKAKGSYNKDTGLITIQVTYSQYGISKILLQNTTELMITKNNNRATSTSEGIELEDGYNTITIIDKQDNKKELKVKVFSAIYATLYSDGTLAFAKSANPIPTQTASSSYWDISGKEYKNDTSIPWYSQRTTITTVEFVNKIKPTSTAYWFNSFYKLETINNIENLNTSNVVNMQSMFHGCTSLTSLDLSNFDTSNVTNMQSMFWSCYNLINIDLASFDTSNVTNMSNMFGACKNLTSIDVSKFVTNKVVNMSQMFYDIDATQLDVSNFNTSNVTYMSSMFKGCSNLTSLDLSNFDTSNVTNMSYMFSGCSSLTSLGLSNFDTSNVTNMSYMFSGYKGETSLDLSNFDTNNVTDMNHMFYNCSITSLDLSNFNNNNVTNMSYMFSSCSITNLNLSSFDTSNVTDMSYMFSGYKVATSLDLSNFNTSNVTNMYSMFYNCISLTYLDLSSFDVSKVTNFKSMFRNCSKLKTIYVNKSTTMWSNSIQNSTSSSSKYYNMFDGCGTRTVTRK